MNLKVVKRCNDKILSSTRKFTKKSQRFGLVLTQNENTFLIQMSSKAGFTRNNLCNSVQCVK